MLTEAKLSVFMLHISTDVYRIQTQTPPVCDLFVELKNLSLIKFTVTADRKMGAVW